jgi:hypothetical protein
MKSFKERIFESYQRYTAQPKQTDFYDGYYIGAQMYARFPELKKTDQKSFRKDINEFAQKAKTGDPYSKGFMAGVRQASLARKSGTLYPKKRK